VTGERGTERDDVLRYLPGGRFVDRSVRTRRPDRFPQAHDPIDRRHVAECRDDIFGQQQPLLELLDGPFNMTPLERPANAVTREHWQDLHEKENGTTVTTSYKHHPA
jgi:hypothetical protein